MVGFSSVVLANGRRRQSVNELLGARQAPGRIPDLTLNAGAAEPTLFDIWQFRALITTIPPETADTVAADLKHLALAHLPSGR